MKPTLKRSFPILIALVLICSLSLSGCGLVREAFSRAAQGKQAGLIPLEDIFAPAEYSGPALSRDGNKVLFRHIRPGGRGDDVVVRDMRTGRETVVPFPEGTDGIPYFEWAGDGQHVLFAIDNSGDENYSLYSVGVADGTTKTLYQKAGATAYIVAMDEMNPDGFYFEVNGRDLQVFDLYWCSVSTGETELVMENPGDVSGWYLDCGGLCRIAKIMDGDGGERLLYRETSGGGTAFVRSEWREILHWSYGDVDTSGFLGFSLDGLRIQYVDSTGRDTAAIMEMDLATGEKTLVYADPDADMAGAWYDLMTDRITAVRCVKERSSWIPLEDGIGRQLDYVASLNGGDFGFASTSGDDRYWLVYFDSDTEGRSYYYVDSRELKGSYLFHESPALKQYEFAPMEPVSFRSSDGFAIHGYATFPQGAARKDLPMVLFVHGGPKARDTWGYNGEVQWLANRGYLVLQVNFRGSTGYGKRFVSAGDREWGGKMQQDLTDAVNWAVAQGYADPDRVAIMGASYGGYAALAGAAFTPGVYACAIDMFGPSSLITLVQSIPDYWEPYRDQLYRSIGNPATDEAFMKSRSPLYHADSITIPVLIAQGGNDVRVLPQESEQMVAAMKARNLDVQYLYFPDAGHGFNTPEDYYSFFAQAERFLARHIGGKAE